MNTTEKGSVAERYIAAWLQDRGWLVASRRHIGGAGDLLAVWPHETLGRHPASDAEAVGQGTLLLLEIKNCKELWQQFRREDRQAMRDTPLPTGGKRYVVNVRGSGDKRKLTWVPEKKWPV